MDVMNTLQISNGGNQMKNLFTLIKSLSKRKNYAKQRRGERGQSLVELSMSLTVLLLLLSGAVDFSVAYFSFSAMRDAAQEGALYGSINPTDETEIISRVRSSSSNPVNLADDSLVNVIVTLPGAACEGNEIKVNVIYDYPISMPFIGAIIGSQQITLKASVTDTILTPACP
jgi:Flp pilus assembly protein TadG